MEKIENGNRQLENGEVISDEELENEIEKWFD
jgi:predicted transcriptional regulator